MSLFDAPDWDSGVAPVASPSKKRKRPSKAPDGATEVKVKAAEINLDKLMKKMQQLEGDGAKGKKLGKGKEKDGNNADDPGKKDPRGQTHSKKEKQKGKRPLKDDDQKRVEQPTKPDSPRKRPKTQNSDATSHPAPPAEPPVSAPTPDPSHQKQKKKKRQSTATEQAEDAPGEVIESAPAELTPLQQSMKQSLGGARFRSVQMSYSAHLTLV